MKKRLLAFVSVADYCSFLDNHGYADKLHSQEVLAAAGALKMISCSALDAFETLKNFSNNKEWLFGHLSYDLKNGIEELRSSHPDHIGFADMCFFIPRIVLQLNEQELTVGVFDDSHQQVYESILSTEYNVKATGPLSIQHRISRQEYISIIQQLKQHILRGDCYEINFCQEFFAEGADIDPVTVYNRLTEISPNPFSCFYRNEDRYLLCASPERFLKKEGDDIFSQPIKGTWHRNLLDAGEDEYNKYQLYHSSKDRSENVMVVDLVRNDLSKVCREGTVAVEELFGIYSFPQVHQMISTVKGKVKTELNIADILKATFPMGSMTGAPKKKVMELIEQYEKTKRGLFSGAVGYISPNGNFDFNVVIRSVLYNSATNYISFQAGSGITFYADPESEYEECLLKATAIRKVLGSVG